MRDRFLIQCILFLCAFMFSGKSVYAGLDCAVEYSKYRKLPNVFLAFATEGGLRPIGKKASDFKCAYAGETTLAKTKQAAIEYCELSRGRNTLAPRCKIIDFRDRSSSLPKNDCLFVARWYRSAHRGYSVVATTGGRSLSDSQSMACVGHFNPNLAVATNRALANCNKQSLLRGERANCKIILSKHGN